MTGGDLFGCHQTTISRNLPIILEAIAKLGNEAKIIKMPQWDEEIRETKSKFHKIGGFPGVIGAIGNFSNIL